MIFLKDICETAFFNCLFLCLVDYTLSHISFQYNGAEEYDFVWSVGEDQLYFRSKRN